MDRRAAVALHHERRDSVAAQEHGHGHADEASAGDEDRDVVVGHALRLPSGQPRSRPPAATSYVTREAP
jgi:hypothetical protein